MNKGKLYICGTPIGNLEDISFRVIKILKKAQVIAAEDTRRTAKLLNYYDINTGLTSYHEHNENEKAKKLLQKLEQGENIALVSDAGMPGISDPGLIIVKKAITAGVSVIPVPGPTAAISALVVSGMDTSRFVFEGFLPRKGKERKERLEAIKNEVRTTIIYESPYRLKETLKEFSALLKNRKIAVVREISKIHEEKIYGTAEKILNNIGNREIKGEIVVVIEGIGDVESSQQGWEDLNILEHLQLMIEQGFSKKKAIKEVARIRDLPKKKVYKEAIVIDARKENR
ncbi:MAG: 16S rRNA (cytidine(1402)-2'-O)-methyltransferase [Halothermotrichaceae bacterium]